MKLRWPIIFTLVLMLPGSWQISRATTNDLFFDGMEAYQAARFTDAAKAFREYDAGRTGKVIFEPNK